MLDEVIENLMEERLFNTADYKNMRTMEYDEWQSQSFSLSDDIMRIMGSRKSIFMQYEELTSLCESALRKNAYRQGFMDGIKLLKSLLSIAP